MPRSPLLDVLTPRALNAWAGTDRLSTLPLHLPSTLPQTRAAQLFALCVAGDAVALPASEPLLAAIPELERQGDRYRTRLSLLPLGRSLLVCDRLDADGGTNVVCWPDDSSYHLAHAIPPGRRTRWLDIGCGSGFAPLLRPELGESIIAVDLNPRAVELARLGAQLSGVEHLTCDQRDLADGITGTFELITCNAPIPANVGPLWRATADSGLFARLFAQLPALLAPGGMFVLHAALDHVTSLVAQLPGERVVVSYVPEGGKQFGLVWWRPDGDARQVVTRRELTPAAPHLTHRDRDAALSDR